MKNFFLAEFQLYLNIFHFKTSIQENNNQKIIQDCLQIQNFPQGLDTCLGIQEGLAEGLFS